MLTFCAPLLAVRRGSLLPDPRYDAVRAIVLSVMDDDEEVPDGGWAPVGGHVYHCIVVVP